MRPADRGLEINFDSKGETKIINHRSHECVFVLLIGGWISCLVPQISATTNENLLPPFNAPIPEDQNDDAVIFDGKSFDGWEGDTQKTWRIENGAIVAGSKTTAAPRNEFLTTTEAYEDFDLSLKFKIDGEKNVNAGVQFRTKRIPDHHEVIGYQADIGPGYDGHLYDESRRRKMLATPKSDVIKKALAAESKDGWNTYRIRAKGDRIQLWLNGIQTVEYIEKDEKIERSGVIALQIHGGMQATIAYKDIVISDLSNEKRRK